MAQLKLRTKSLSPEELETNRKTREHIDTVATVIDGLISELNDRIVNHDASKLEDPELTMFTKFSNRLKDLVYGTPEYKKCLADMGPALDHHYANNRHHPEYHDNGIDDMNLIDVLEMIADWKASTLRYKDGDIIDSIAINKKRFGISDQLAKIIENTVPLLNRNIEK